MGDADSTTVVVADDHAVVRRGLRALFAGCPDIEVVAEPADLDATFVALREHRPRVLVLDLHMAGESSLGAIGDLQDASPDTRIVVLTMQTDPVFARQALMGGAAGFLTKEAPDDDVVEAIRAVASNGTYLDSAVGVGAVTGTPAGRRTDHGLSPRETDVLRLVALGHTNAEIADELHMSLRTVETHRSHIQQKLRLSRRSDLVRYALAQGLVNP